VAHRALRYDGAGPRAPTASASPYGISFGPGYPRAGGWVHC